MIYLTYNDQPTGVFSSQVNDVCNFLNKNLDAKIKLVAIISIRNFKANRTKIRNEVPGAIVFPALPKANYWKFSSFVFALLCLFTGEKIVVSRNVIATKIALFARRCGIIRTVCIDGRGAIAAEWNEYEVVAYQHMKTSISEWEKTAVLQSDFRIAVSTKLVEWWRTAYGYHEEKHIVIPCTLQSAWKEKIIEQNEMDELRKNAGFDKNDIILVYSGSASGWQSFSSLERILGNLLKNDPNSKLVFLSQSDPTIEELKEKYPGKVSNHWLPHTKVSEFLVMCDYGILYREKNVTNKVAAPTKFAEYLSAGLPVLISEEIGDYSDFVNKYNCGLVMSDNTLLVVENTSIQRRNEMIKLATRFYTKEAHKDSYRKLITTLVNN